MTCKNCGCENDSQVDPLCGYCRSLLDCGLEPKGEELDALVDKYPAPREFWEEEHVSVLRSSADLLDDYRKQEMTKTLLLGSVCLNFLFVLYHACQWLVWLLT